MLNVSRLTARKSHSYVSLNADEKYDFFFSFYYRIQSLFITYLIASHLLRHRLILNEKFQVKID